MVDDEDDSGSVTLTVNGHPDSIYYGSASTSSSLASALASAINSDANAAVTAAASGSIVSLTSKASGAGANYAMSLTTQSNTWPAFNPPSFASSTSGPALTGGTGGYGFALLYAPNGNLLAANDSANGNWTYTYDDFNRLTGSACSQHCPDAQNTQGFSYVYDRYANRWQQNVTAGSGYAMLLSFSSNNNRMDGHSYDASGNLLNDGTHSYAYDAESRIISVDNGATATYVYDPEGRRVKKTTAAGAVYYLYDLAGHQSNELSSSGALNRSELYAGGHHLATYTGGTTYFDHADWLGTERARSGLSGVVCETVASLSFGDGQVTNGSCGDPSPMHFTGKQRDTESGLDDFDARYDSSSLGRFMSTDPVLVTSERLGDPQQLNEYAYVRNNPLRFVDPTGEILELSGNIPAAENYVCIIAGAKCDEVTFTNDVHGRVAVTVSLAFLYPYADQGQILLWQLVTSPSLYVLSVASTMTVNTSGKNNVLTASTVTLTSDELNLPVFPSQEEHDHRRPENGINDQVTINPNAIVTSLNNLGVPPRWTVAFHELAEAYEKIDGKVKIYAQGHNAANDREAALRDSRPYLKQFNPGSGGPANGKNVTKVEIKQR